MTPKTALRLPADMMHARDDQKRDRSTHFVFEHQVFAVPNAYFSLTEDRKPAFHVNYGDLRAAIELRSLRRGFSIPPHSHDDEMLGKVEGSLRFVRKIKPNDSIPREVLDGTASWATDETHREVAHSRLTLQLTSWMTGRSTGHLTRDQIRSLAGNPEVVSRVQGAVAEIVEKIGLRSEEKHLIVDRIEAFAKELSYVEAIRERFEGTHMIQKKVAQLLALYKADRFVGDNLMRVAALMREPMSAFGVIFGRVDAMIADILGICQKFDEKVADLRIMRDDLFELYLLWEPILQRWQEQPIVKDKFTEETVRMMFQFLARHYPQQSTWKRA